MLDFLAILQILPTVLYLMNGATGGEAESGRMNKTERDKCAQTGQCSLWGYNISEFHTSF